MLLAVGGIEAIAASASAYSLDGGKWPQAAPGQPVTITYSYLNLLDGGLRGPDGVSLPTALIRSSIEEALAHWAAAAPLHFLEVPDQGGPVVYAPYPDGQFGQIRFAHMYINGPDLPGQPPAAKALSIYPYFSGNIGGDVFFDNGDPWQLVGTLPTPDLLGAALHEIGHSLGLGHVADPDATMYPVFPRFSGPGSARLSPDDIAGIQALYGAGAGSVTPIPEPGSLALLATFAARLLLRRQPPR